MKEATVKAKKKQKKAAADEKKSKAAAIKKKKAPSPALAAHVKDIVDWLHQDNAAGEGHSDAYRYTEEFFDDARFHGGAPVHKLHAVDPCPDIPERLEAHGFQPLNLNCDTFGFKRLLSISTCTATPRANHAGDDARGLLPDP
jgi:hypothetical protein